MPAGPACRPVAGSTSPRRYEPAATGGRSTVAGAAARGRCRRMAPHRADLRTDRSGPSTSPTGACSSGRGEAAVVGSGHSPVLRTDREATIIGQTDPDGWRPAHPIDGEAISGRSSGRPFEGARFMDGSLVIIVRGRRDRAGLRLHQRIPRHGQRDGHVDRDRRAAPEGRGRRSRASSTWSAPSCRSRWRRRSPAGWSTRRRSRPVVIFAGLVGAILWNLLTWLLGLPSSSSHALFGGLIGATLVAGGPDAVNFDSVLDKVIAAGGGLARRRRPGRRSPRPTWPTGSPPGPTPARSTRGSARPGGVGVDGRAGPRHQRRAEDHGRHHADPDHRRHARAGLGPPFWVVLSAGLAIGARHLHGRLADHPDPRPAGQRHPA